VAGRPQYELKRVRIEGVVNGMLNSLQPPWKQGQPPYVHGSPVPYAVGASNGELEKSFVPRGQGREKTAHLLLLSSGRSGSGTYIGLTSK